jgi:uncharacterized protein
MGLAGRIARAAIRWRRSVLAASLALSTLCLLSFTRLHLDIDLLSMLPAGQPAFDDYERLLATFGATQTVVALVDGVGGPTLTRALDRLAERYRALPAVRSATAGLEPSTSAPYLDPAHAPAFVPAARFGELAARLAPRAVVAAVIQAKRLLAVPTGPDLVASIRRDPLGLTRVVGETLRDGYADPLVGTRDPHFVTADRDAGLVLIEPTGSPFDAEFTTALFTGLREAEAETRGEDPAFASLRVRHAGAYAHAREDAALIRGDVVRYTLLALVAVTLIFQLGFRNLTILPIVCYPLIAGSLLAFAASVLLYQRLNALSLSFAAIFYGLAIDSGIHFYARLLGERRRAPLEDAVVRACDGIGAALLVASLTTAAAFAVISCSAIAAVHQIGVLTALGMLVNVAHTFIVLPALTTTFPGRLAAAPSSREALPWVGVVAGAAARRPWPVVAIAALVVVTWLGTSRPVPVDADVLHLRPTRSPATATEDEVAARFGGGSPQAAVVIAADNLDDALAREERVTAWLEQHRSGPPALAIRSYQALSTFLPARATERARRAAFAALPRARARRTLHRALARHGFRVAEFAAAEAALTDDAARLPRDPSAQWLAALARRHLHAGPDGVRLALLVEPGPGADLAAIRERLRTEVDPGVVVTGRALMQTALERVIQHEILWFTAATFVLNLALVLARFRSLSVALAVMAPTIVALLALLTGMAFTGVAFTPVNLIVLPLVFGIGVDDCLYLAERVREGHDYAEAAALVGRAIVLTTLTTMAGFGFLAVSRYPALAGLGWLAAISLGLTLVSAVVLLPAFLALASHERRQTP